MCYLCVEDAKELDPRVEEEYQPWIDEQRLLTRLHVDKLFRPLRMQWGLATLTDMTAEVWEENVRYQLRPDPMNNRVPRPSGPGYLGVWWRV